MITPQVQPEAYPFNSAEIKRGDYASLGVEFYAGDIVAVKSDALIVSSFSGDYLPVPGSVLGSLADRFGIVFGTTRPEGTLSVSPNLHKFPTGPCPVFNDLWILEIKAAEQPTPVSLSDVKKAFAALKQSSQAMLHNSVRSISLPLIGTGFVGLPLEDVIAETMILLKWWAIKAPTLQIVRVFAIQLESVAKLSNMIDVAFGFPDQPAASALVAAAAGEMEGKLMKFADPLLREALARMAHLGKMDSPSAKSICLEGRMTAEICAKMLFQRLKPGAPNPGKLIGLINEVEAHIKGTNQLWILNYFKLLQTCGNNAAHASAVNVNLTDAGAVIVAALRVAEFTDHQ